MDLAQTLRSSFLLRRFSVFYLVFALLPLAILFSLYLEWDPESSSLVISREHLGLLIGLAAIASLLSFFAMRQILARVSVFTEGMRRVVFDNVDPQTILDLAQGEGEVAELAQTFQEVIGRLETNIAELKSTRDALHQTLSKIGHAVSSIEDLDQLVRLVLETSADALGARRAAVFAFDEGRFAEIVATGVDTVDQQALVQEARPHLDWLASQRRMLILGSQPGDEDRETVLETPLICSPLSHRGKLRGALILAGNRFGGDFDEDEVRIVVTLSSQLATLFENAELSAERERTYFETMTALALAVEARDPYSRGHSDRVVKYAERIARAMGFSETELKTIRDAALLHDIGKIGITDAILHKPTPLDAAEMEIIKKHPVIGERIVMPLQTFQELLDPIRHHHEFLDGSGYPDGLEGDAISSITRVMAVADIFDALTTDRPYRKALSVEAAGRILREMADAGKVDPAVVDTLSSLTAGGEIEPSRVDPGLPVGAGGEVDLARDA